jgi:hypothetical protein
LALSPAPASGKPRSSTRAAKAVPHPHRARPSRSARRSLPRWLICSRADREHTEELIAKHAADLKENLNDKALANHLQRIVGSFVSSACSSGDFYSDKVGEARRLTSRLDNDERDEDRDPVSGFDSRADRAREFAGKVGLQAVALLAAAEGAVSAYSHITGEDWRPYEPPAAPSQSVARKSAATQIAALGG